MTLLQEKILALDGQTAVNILKAIAQAQLRATPYQTEMSPEMRQAMAREFEVAAQPALKAKEGDLARQALLVLTEEPQFSEPIRTMIDAPSQAERFLGVGEGVALVTAALVALQTHVRFERDKDGRWSLKFEKKPTSEELLKQLVQKLLAFIKG